MEGDPSPPSAAIYTIGAIFLVYGAGEALVLEMLFLVGLQGADESTQVLPSLVFPLVVPALLAITGRAMMRGRSWGYGVAALLPVLIVPLAAWILDDPATRGTLWLGALEYVGVGAVFALGSVLPSLAVGYLWLKAPRPR